MPRAIMSLIEAIVGVLVVALAIGLWRAGTRWSRAAAALLALAGIAAIANALVTVVRG